MSQPCAINKCIRSSRGLCDCCQQQLCIQHLSEHNTVLINQLNPLTDEFNTLSDRLNALNIENITGKSRRKLEQWRDRCHQQIDSLFDKKCRELDAIMNEKIQKQREQVNQLQSKIAEVLREQETTRQQIDSLTSTVHDLKEEMNAIEKTSFRMTTQRLVIDDALISIEATTEHELDLLNLPPSCKTIKYLTGSKLVLCANDDYLLMHQKPNLCLVDRDMNIVKEVPWNYETIFDMCWCSTLDRFIVNEGSNIFLVDESTMTIEKVEIIEQRKWLSCITSDTYLFLVTYSLGSSVIKYSLVPSMKLVTEWKSPHTCAENEFIANIKYNKETLAVLIKNPSEKSLRMELRSIDTFSCIWLLRFDTVCGQDRIFRLCPLSCDEWLLTDYQTKRLVQVTKDGKLKAVIQYESVPWNATMFRNILAVWQNNGINLHKL